MVEVSDVRYVKRISVGTSDPGHILSEEEIQKAVDLLNNCLLGTPRGKIIAIESRLRH